MGPTMWRRGPPPPTTPASPAPPPGTPKPHLRTTCRGLHPLCLTPGGSGIAATLPVGAVTGQRMGTSVASLAAGPGGTEQGDQEGGRQDQRLHHHPHLHRHLQPIIQNLF